MESPCSFEAFLYRQISEYIDEPYDRFLSWTTQATTNILLISILILTCVLTKRNCIALVFPSFPLWLVERNERKQSILLNQRKRENVWRVHWNSARRFCFHVRYLVEASHFSFGLTFWLLQCYSFLYKSPNCCVSVVGWTFLGKIFCLFHIQFKLHYLHYY